MEVDQRSWERMTALYGPRPGYGRSVVFFQSPNHIGLVGLDGIVAPPTFPGLAGDTECRR